VSQQSVRAVVSVLGKDQKGVVAQFATYMAERGINIDDMEQRVVRGFFVMDMLVDLKDLTVDLTEIISGLLDLGNKIDMEVRVNLRSERKRKRTAILVSKEPHCLEHLIEQHRAKRLNGDFTIVLANHPDLEPVAKAAGLPFAWHPHTDLKSHFDWLLKQLKQHQVDLVVLARYMRILTGDFLTDLATPVINIHHSFLPAFAGANPYQRAFERGVKIIGATAHYVTEELDAGPIIEQDVARVSHREHAETMVRLGRDIERTVLARAVKWHLEDRVLVHGNRTVVF
jgi:formyltetrahydrofolate deformylase